MSTFLKKKVLVADDFENTLFVIKFTLENAGYEVVTAKNGQQALELLQMHRVKLIVTDYNMPIVNGLQFVKEVKRFPDTMNIPIVILSTESNPDKKNEVLKAGAAAWVKKPFQTEEFLNLIARLAR